MYNIACLTAGDPLIFKSHRVLSQVFTDTRLTQLDGLPCTCVKRSAPCTRVRLNAAENGLLSRTRLNCCKDTHVHFQKFRIFP